MTSKIQFVKEFRAFLRTLKQDTTVTEFRRWINNELVSFRDASAHEQFEEKINYELSIGNDELTFSRIAMFLRSWANEHEVSPIDYIWYRGIDEKKFDWIMQSGLIGVSNEETCRPGFEHDVGTVSLAKNKRHARLFSLGQGNPIILHIDIRRQLDPNKIKYRDLFGVPKGELLYYDDIPTEAIVKVEKI